MKINTSLPKTHSTQWNKLHHNCAAWSFYWSMLSVAIIVRWLLCDEIPVLVTVVTLRLFLQISTFLYYESRFLQQRNNVSIISTLSVVVVYYSIIFIIRIWILYYFSTLFCHWETSLVLLILMSKIMPLKWSFTDNMGSSLEYMHTCISL